MRSDSTGVAKRRARPIGSWNEHPSTRTDVRSAIRSAALVGLPRQADPSNLSSVRLRCSVSPFV